MGSPIPLKPALALATQKNSPSGKKAFLAPHGKIVGWPSRDAALNKRVYTASSACILDAT